MYASGAAQTNLTIHFLDTAVFVLFVVTSKKMDAHPTPLQTSTRRRGLGRSKRLGW
jgi:hypothetical protein